MSSDHLPEPRLTRVYRLEATLGQPLDVGERPPGHRRIVPLTGGTFTGPDLYGKLLPGASADWQTILPMAPRSATSATRCRSTPAICSTSKHEVCATAAPRSSHDSGGRGRRPQRVHLPDLNQDRGQRPPGRLLNKGVFISVGGRQADTVVYETYLVG
jgi:hypothetical protein